MRLLGSVARVKLFAALFALSFTTLLLPSLHAGNGPEPGCHGLPLSYWLDVYFLAFTTLLAPAPQAQINAAVLHRAATGLRSRDLRRQDWAAQVLRAAGQRPDCAVPSGDMKAVYREVTNALSRLSPVLCLEYVAAQCRFIPATPIG